ncbi:recombinase family protein [Synechococcus sp. AH-551-G03]|nr:recombinase family protein [Synechococcus sp. AH-551-G03]
MFENRVRDSNAPCSETGGLTNAPKSVGYARVSTQHQNLEQQLAALKTDGCDLTFGEKVSSTIPAEKRQGLQEALAALEPGDTLVVAKLDRLGRTQSEVVARLAALQSEGKYVRTLDGLLNTAGLGKLAPLVVGLLTGLAEVERNLVQERTRESVEHRRRTGGNIGGRPALGAERAALVARLRSEGLSFRKVAEVAGVSLPTAYRYGNEASPV